MLKKDSPQSKVGISYADPGANHKGIIYRASNWLYQGLLEVSFYGDYKMDNGKHFLHFSSDNYYLKLFLIMMLTRNYTFIQYTKDLWYKSSFFIFKK